MTIEVKVPMLPESIADATIATWHKKQGDKVSRDENLVDLETDKVMLEVPAPADGIIKEILKPNGETVQANQVVAIIETGNGAALAPAKPVMPEAAKPAEKPAEKTSQKDNSSLSPSARRAVAEHEVDVSSLKGTGKDGRITKENVMQAAVVKAPTQMTSGARPEKRVPMTRIRARIAERLLEVRQNTAMLTTFNEINLQDVMDLRARYKEKFEKMHHSRLGFMSFFVKAAVEALKRFPTVNASIDGNDIVYHGYFDIGVAVSTDRGLVVPVLRDADQMSMAEIENQIAEFAVKARNAKLTMEEMQGGTFTITNGGVFGSLLSTPILNSPQSAILGMHTIQQRPVVENGQVVVRPMMYVAMSYDHRIIDGKDSVSFLVSIKELLEDPARLLLEV
ncbi:MAG TPA: 2-oxoglutarate dehydrogenase complex dihydrolipoyllysine-residue succinyltransferase [Gammaproteobacteria bacterium]|nr:2-oxoglutarate dehydrogenase complex dihydrolipoyllysine-residue succinyltransferase [Gammaproteobacteria bacterium]